MPGESNKTVEQIFRTAMRVLTALVLAIPYLLVANCVQAQQYPLRPPNLAPSRPSVYAGVFYMNAGIRFRNIQEVSFSTTGQDLFNITNAGVAAFGPQANDRLTYPQVPVIASLDFNQNGLWVYDDGFISPTGGDAATFPTSPSDSTPAGYVVAFPDAGIGLGRVTAFGATAPVDNGVWRVYDQYLQLNPGYANPFTNSAGETPALNSFQSVTFSSLLTPGRSLIASQGFVVTMTPEMETRSTSKILTPFLETGYQFGNYVDLFAGLSWFDISEKFNRVRNGKVVNLARRGYRDTFPLQLTDTESVIGNGFGSDDIIVNESGFASRVIYPLGLSVSGSEFTPQRVFFDAIDPQGNVTAAGTPQGPFIADEFVAAALDFSVYETRQGVRSWFPLYGLGRIATSAGGMVAPMVYHLISQARYVATTADPTYPVAVGDVLINVTNNHTDLYWNYGAFAGVELEVGGGTLYFKGAAEYNWHLNPLKYGDIPEIKINIGGLSASGILGVRF